MIVNNDHQIKLQKLTYESFKPSTSDVNRIFGKQMLDALQIHLYETDMIYRNSTHMAYNTYSVLIFRITAEDDGYLIDFLFANIDDMNPIHKALKEVYDDCVVDKHYRSLYSTFWQTYNEYKRMPVKQVIDQFGYWSKLVAQISDGNITLYNLQYDHLTQLNGWFISDIVVVYELEADATLWDDVLSIKD